MINESILDPQSSRPRAGRPVKFALSVAILLTAAFFAYRTWAAQPPAPAPTERVVISAAELEERYGLRLRLVGVTAGGGLIDFRLKIVDAAQARQILENPERTPTLIVEGGDVLLSLPRRTDQAPDLKLKDDDVFIALIPNKSSVVKPGTPVVVTFGDLQLEPVLAQ
jgi:hypothetical protein